jgi:hypothetical protein
MTRASIAKGFVGGLVALAPGTAAQYRISCEGAHCKQSLQSPVFTPFLLKSFLLSDSAKVSR